MFGRKPESKSVFNGEGVDHFLEFNSVFMVKADKEGCKQHLSWKPEDVREDGSVPEEVFLYERECAPGMEQVAAEARVNSQIRSLDELHLRKIAIIEAAGYPVAERRKEVAKLQLDLESDKAKFQSGLYKAVNDLRTATALFDKREKDFNDARAAAVTLLMTWLGPTPLAKVQTTLETVGPKNAWKMIVDQFTTQAETNSHIDTVFLKMQNLVFTKAIGKVEDHMGLLDKWNATLIRQGKGMDDAILLNHLMSAIRKNKQVLPLYEATLEDIFRRDLKRAEAMKILVRVEQRQYNEAELKGEVANAQGAQFASVRAYAAAADTSSGKKRSFPSKGGSQSGNKAPRREKKSGGGLTCFRCGGPHGVGECEKKVYCKPCNSHNHDGKVCFKSHPDIKEKYLKYMENRQNKELSTKVRDNSGTRETLAGEGVCSLPAVATALGLSSSDKVPSVDGSGVMTLDEDIGEELVHKIDMQTCVRCADNLCSLAPPEDGDESKLVEVAAQGLASGQPVGLIVLIIDSGATRHMVPWRWMFTTLSGAVRGKVTLGSKSYSLDIEGGGDVALQCLTRVLWVPSLSMGLLSMTQLDAEGYSTVSKGGRCVVRDRSGAVVLTATMRRKLYVVDPEYVDILTGAGGEEEIALSAMVNRAVLEGSAQSRLSQLTAGQGGLDLLHRRLGHISETKLRQGLKDGNWIGAQYTYEDLKNERMKFCPACYEGAMKAFPRQPVSEREVEPGAKFGVDYKGPFSVQSIDGYNGFYLMCDYGSNYLMVFLVKSKSAEVTKSVLEEFYRKIKLMTKTAPGVMQCDYDTVLQSEGITRWLKEHDIKLQMSAPYTHWQNGKIERNIGKVMDTARKLMAAGRVPKTFWSWAVRCAVYQLNRHPVNKKKTPVEEASGEVPDISLMVPFWSIGVYHKTAAERKGPWDHKAVRVRMVGYCEEAKNSYYVYEIGTPNVIKVRHDCVWDETEVVQEVGQDNLNDEPGVDDLAVIEEQLRAEGRLDDSEEELVDTVDGAEEEYWKEVGGQPYWGLLTDVEEWIEDVCAMNARVQAKESGVDPLEPLEQPATLKEALEGPERVKWIAALLTEIDNFKLRNVFAKAEQTGRAMKTKLILRKTRKPDGSIKYKVRLVAKGFTQIKGINYNETYAPTTSTSVVFVVMNLAVIMKLDLSSFDVTAAFLEGKNDYPNFAWIPEGFGEYGGQRVQVVGNFYGEKQGPKLWNDRLHEIMKKGEFERCPVHPCLYKKVSDKGMQFMCVHVDDGLAATDNKQMTADFMKHLLSEVREATFDDNVRKYIGIDVSVTDSANGPRVKLTHEQYINDNWSEFADSAAVDIPMCPSHNLRKAEPVERELTMLHDTGKFRFAADRGRPDISVAVGEVSTGGGKNPSYLHEVVAERTKKYLWHTRTLGVELGEGELEIFGYSDAAYITEGNSKSRLGGCIFLNRNSGAVRSFSKTDTQPSSLSHSSTEAEIKAMDEWAREVLHLLDIVSFLIGRRYHQPVKLLVDNQSAIQLCTTLRQSSNCKHINMRINFLRELVEAGVIEIYYVNTELNVADMLTKALAERVFTTHREKLMTGHRGKLPAHRSL